MIIQSTTKYNIFGRPRKRRNYFMNQH